MSSTLIISIIAGLIIFSIVVSAISYSRQQALAKRKKQFKKHKENADEMLNHVHLLSIIDPKYDLLALIQAQTVAELQNAFNLMPDEPRLAPLLKSESERLASFKEGKRDNEVIGFLKSDGELNKSRVQLSQVSKLLDIFNNRHDISKARKQELQEYIRRLTLDVEVNSHLHQAHQFGEQNDIVMYQLHIKHARECLKKSSIEVDKKNERIKELSEILTESKKTNKVVETG